ncbi:hypothetical protein KAZ66_02330 [Candidatus Woesebacteria bacterium]|nr:hypothetical protein [Candidatus Woesebacteria bacterium]
MITFAVLAATVDDVFGRVSPPPGSGWGANPISGIGTLVIFIIQMFLILGGLAALFYMLWGAFDWINSGGDPDSISKARLKITHAALGIVLMVAALGIFVLLSTDILQIIKRGPNGEWLFNIPTINKCIEAGKGCDHLGASKCCAGLSCAVADPVLGTYTCQ